MNTGLAGTAAAGVLGGGPSGGPSHHASPIGQDRLVRREVALGTIREIVPPMQHMGLQFCPWLEVESDDVIFNYALGDVDGLAPARAEDAESELAQKDDIFGGEGRASIIDWAVKDHYKSSDVNRAREWLKILEIMRDSNALPLTAGAATEGWQDKLARDTLKRRRKLDNRIEWLIMSVLSTAIIAYNDGKIKFSVDYGRPAGQARTLGTHTNINGNASYPLGALWSSASSDPIRDIISVQEFIYDTYGVRVDRAITSRKVLNRIINSDKFAARTGLVAAATPVPPVDPNYLIDGWGPLAAQQVVERATGIQFIEYDAVYRTRPFGSQTVTTTRFLPENRIIFLPVEADIADFDETQIGFGKLLTSPHPAGDWTAGFYEWEREYGPDPWRYDVGTGVKAFPVMPHMDKTITLDVI